MAHWDIKFYWLYIFSLLFFCLSWGSFIFFTFPSLPENISYCLSACSLDLFLNVYYCNSSIWFWPLPPSSSLLIYVSISLDIHMKIHIDKDISSLISMFLLSQLDKTVGIKSLFRLYLLNNRSCYRVLGTVLIFIFNLQFSRT